MNLESIGIKNYTQTQDKNKITSCSICSQPVNRRHYKCPNCERVVGYGCCSDIALPNYISNKPWLSRFNGVRLCYDCLGVAPRQDNGYINTLFSEIFK